MAGSTGVQWLLSLVILVTVNHVCLLEKAPVRGTEYGRVQGMITEPLKGLKVANYLGIPYAKPPIDRLRFQVRYFLLLLLAL